MPSGRTVPAPRGFTYLGLLLAIALAGATLGLAAQSWHLQGMREVEREQIFRGEAIARALASYRAGPDAKPLPRGGVAAAGASAAPGVQAAAGIKAGQPGGALSFGFGPSAGGGMAAAASATGGEWPKRLEDLLEDRRGATPRRHLRRVYDDPCTGRPDWALQRDAAGGIVALHSRCERRALLKKGLEDADGPTEPRLSDRRFGGAAPEPEAADVQSPAPQSSP